jgi:N-acetylglucosaminyldiphosphoundecaprenol N-acetyl-beta-D-mannosaminyltransferase
LNEKYHLQGAFVCAGGTIDFLAKLKKRAPKFIQNLGLEWSFRLIQDPVRLFDRYLKNAVFISPYLIKAIILKKRRNSR